MRKVNKILMATVAILLCLVLISTSVVSGIFARYVITKTASVSMNIEAFGVTLKVTPSVEGATVTNNENRNMLPNLNDWSKSLNVEIKDLGMVPGDAFYDALKVEITGNPNVDIVLKMSCHFEYTQSNYTVDGTSYMPLAYTIHFGDNVKQDLCFPYQASKTNEDFEEIIVRNVYNKLFDTDYKNNTSKPVGVSDLDSTSNDYSFTKEFKADSTHAEYLKSDAKARSFYIGFEFPDKGRDANGEKSKSYDNIATALSETATPIKFVLSFTIEQKTTT